MSSKHPHTQLLILLAILIALAVVQPVAAQNEGVLYSFNHANNGQANPWLSLVFDTHGHLYGGTQTGGVTGLGEIFELVRGTDGGWTIKSLYKFLNLADGTIPTTGLIIDSAGNIYGTTYGGGTYQTGTVFELLPNADGTWTHKILHMFGHGTDGQFPQAGMIFDSAGNLYGTTQGGGNNRTGTVFELIPGSGGTWTERILYHFGASTSTDAQQPGARLIFDSAGNLYSSTLWGGANGGGTVFKLSPHAGAGWTETVLYSFAYYSEPYSSVVFDSAGNLYGTTGEGGANGLGSVYELSPQPDGTWNETTLHSFSGGKDGFNSFPGLTFDSMGNLYGATMSGGAYGGLNGDGTVYKLTPGADGTWIKSIVLSFDGTDGSAPTPGNLIFDSSGNLYGGAAGGGTYLGGVVFEIKP